MFQLLYLIINLYAGLTYLIRSKYLQAEDKVTPGGQFIHVGPSHRPVHDITLNGRVFPQKYMLNQNET